MNWNKVLFSFAATGWTLGLIVNLTAMIAHYDLTNIFPPLFLLHVGIFVVFLPAILQTKSRMKALGDKPTFSTNLQAAFGNTPTWLKVIAAFGFAYALVNWFAFVGNNHGSPAIQDGQYVLLNRGKLIRVITLEEYSYAKANITRGFSGHWIAFYGVAAAVLYPFGKGAEAIASPNKG